MKRVVSLPAILSAVLVVGACGSGEVVVRTELEADMDTATAGEAGESMVLSDLEVWVLPYDRDVIFDSLSNAHPEPEPPIPDSILELQERIADAQQRWQQIESEWIAVRDSLQRISRQMEGLNRSSGEYVLLFREFNELEPQEQALERQNDSAFRQFTDLQSRFVDSTEEITALRDQWAMDAFAPIDTVIAARLEQLDREEYADTTDATGIARFALPPGQWWVHARYELPYSELYWNIPVEVERGDPVEVVLRRESAEGRANM